MKNTHYLKPRFGQEIANRQNSNHNAYWTVFKRWPNEINWKIDNPKYPEYLEVCLEAEGFTVEIRTVTNPGEESVNRYEDRHTDTFINRKKKVFLSQASTNDLMKLNMLFPVDSMDYALRMHRRINDAVGTTGPVSGRVNLLSMECGDFLLVGVDIPKPEVDLALNYGHAFIEVDKDIKDFIKGRESGLVLLHGISGSGKSTYIYHLIHECRHKMIFIPNNMIASMSNPDFIAFMLENAKDSVLIVEDAEKVLLKRGGPGDAGVSTLLNITDGILGKIMRCKVICTFNIERSELDDALLRKGRLRTEHVFDKLSPREANRLLEHLGKDTRTHEPMILADIYNETGGTEITTSTVGFH